MNPTDEEEVLSSTPVQSFAEGGRVLMKLLMPILITHGLLDHKSELKRLQATYRDRDFIALAMKVLNKAQRKGARAGDWHDSLATLAALRQVGALREYCGSDAYARELASYLIRS